MPSAPGDQWSPLPITYHSLVYINIIHHHTGDHLRIEIGGFLRHFFSGGGDVADLGDARGIEDKGALEVALVYLQNKGDLVRELAKTNELLASFLMEEGALWHGKD